MRPFIGCMDLLVAVAVVLVLVLAVRVLSRPSSGHGRCLMYQEHSLAVFPSARALLCYKSLVEALVAVLVCVYIAFSTTHNRYFRKASSSKSSAPHDAIASSKISKPMEENSSCTSESRAPHAFVSSRRSKPTDENSSTTEISSASHAIAPSRMSKPMEENLPTRKSSDHSDTEHKMDDESVAELMLTRLVHHDIFLLYCGNQKDFVSDLHRMLHSKGYSTFFDITRHRLPPGNSLPPLILEAPDRCRLAVVVLSNEFLLSRWPMIELCAFVEAQSSSSVDQQHSIMKILPLLYELSPPDLDHEENLQKWQHAWKAHAKFDPKGVINVEKWGHALRVLREHEGVNVFDPLGVDGTTPTHIENIMSSISKIVKPTTKHDTSGVQGKERLCKILGAKFQELQSGRPSPSRMSPRVPSQSARVCVLGMYGLPGSGKSTLSKCLCDYYIRQFCGRTVYLELPTNPTHEQLVKTSEELLEKVTNCSNVVDLAIENDFSQVCSHVQGLLERFSVFLVVDNITAHPLASEFVRRILTCNVKAGSKVLLVAGTHSVLHSLLVQYKYKYACGSVQVPSINKKEAIQVAYQYAATGRLQKSCASLDKLDFRDREIIKEVIPKSTFGTSDQRVYLPWLLDIVGTRLREDGYFLQH